MTRFSNQAKNLPADLSNIDIENYAILAVYLFVSQSSCILNFQFFAFFKISIFCDFIISYRIWLNYYRLYTKIWFPYILIENDWITIDYILKFDFLIFL